MKVKFGRRLLSAPAAARTNQQHVDVRVGRGPGPFAPLENNPWPNVSAGAVVTILMIGDTAMTDDSPWSTAFHKLRERVAAASPEPWTLEHDPDGATFISIGRPDDKNQLVAKRDLAQASEADVAFIALARNVVPRLVEALASDDLDSFSLAELDQIDAAANAATGGPWTPFLEGSQPIGGCSVIWVGGDSESDDLYLWLGGEIAPDADIDFVAHAREDVPLLSAEIRRRKMPANSS